MSWERTPKPKPPKKKRRPRPPRPAHTPKDHAWWELKKLVLIRPGGEGFYKPNGDIFVISYGRCERCGEQQATDAHHRILVSEGGPDSAGNLAALCRFCHSWVHANPLEARGGGWIVSSFRDYLVVAILRWDGALVTLDDEGSYSFAAVP